MARLGRTVVLALLMLAGCATEYGPAGFLKGGYRDEAIGNDQYHISVGGNPATGVGTVSNISTAALRKS